MELMRVQSIDGADCLLNVINIDYIQIDRTGERPDTVVATIGGRMMMFRAGWDADTSFPKNVCYPAMKNGEDDYPLFINTNRCP